MAEKNLVEEALIQIQNLEEAINENAKEILHSTMKEEISELVKESMKNEAEEEDEFEIEDEIESDDESEEEDESEEDEDSEEGFDMMDLSDMGDEDENEFDVQDLSDEPMSTVLKAFKEMKPTDSFEIKKEGDFIHLKDEEDEYLIQDGSEDDEFGEFGESQEEETEEMVYEIEMDSLEEEETEEMVYEIEMDSFDDDDELYIDYMEEEMDPVMESFKAKLGKGAAKVGDAKKASTFKKTEGGFKTVKKTVNKTMGTGKPKFEFKEGDVFEMPSPHNVEKFTKEEAKEASRTYGFGSKKGRGLRKAITPNRNLTFENHEIMEEVEMLRAKNEEYRKALNMFRDKLNEVAIFNSNLAYATRLFTEHSTSKQEKINILRRFDSAESLKESKALYKNIKDELHIDNSKKFVNESIERVIEKTPQSGSAVNLIESKTYENPQFLRMKDIMSKIIK